ncbi:MAG: hypothetical protein B7Z37_13620 [Verrucomicrobia bacterium 12-59-8]|nr:MAG: hypothetical protein B7Z37_13620 [Verrucomicrobia bacterium 12-59-8]
MNPKLLSSLSLIFTFILVLLGAIGMLITFLFLWSSDVRDIAGAGLGFVAGAVMLGSGVVALAILSRVPRGDAVVSNPQ